MGKRIGIGTVTVVVSAALAGCGGAQEGSDAAEDCAPYKQFAVVKAAMDRIDRRMQNLDDALEDLSPRITAENAAAQLRSASSAYGAASAEYAALIDRAAGDGGTEVPWSLLQESLTFRRDGTAFFATVFGDVSKLPGAEARIQEIANELVSLNEELLQASTAAYREGGFDERADGQFVIDCQ